MRAKQRGARWTPEDICTLKELWDAGKELKEICVELERTGNAVCSKLSEQGFLQFDNRNYTYYHGRKSDLTGQVYANQSFVRGVDRYMKEVDPNAPWEEFYGK